MDATADGILVEREIRIEAARETVWECLTDPDQHVRWMGEVADLEPMPGGRYEVRVVPGRTAKGVFLEMEPPSRLLISWGWEPAGARSPLPPPGSTTVEFRLIALGDATLLRLTHRRNPTAESAAGHARGWEHYLARLAQLAAGQAPGPDPWITTPPI